MFLYGIAISEQEALFLIVSVLFWVAIIGGVGAVLRTKVPVSGRGAGSREEDMLFRRFVDGEIDDDEYRFRREALRQIPHPCGHDGS
ncbi:MULTISPECIES: SHOCT domain-containing protein [Planotetraspora]|uniref:SHOCT domain-containing protein n=2 Tax=Planotetraspora TaxID=58120 RepID=A0A8J3XR80_9ACTN|nr:MULTISPECIES: hypothetical protein [Planotetraspora]GII31129.1 hypothetical protein Pmi06nite_45710 [Planotetraspora mira]GII49925.1 hypothetical protein Psi02_63490 [Planotetraspora silvatica]